MERIYSCQEKKETQAVFKLQKRCANSLGIYQLANRIASMESLACLFKAFVSFSAALFTHVFNLVIALGLSRGIGKWP